MGKGCRHIVAKSENKSLLYVFNTYLQVLPAAAAGKILNNEPIICPYRWTISVSSPAPISTL